MDGEPQDESEERTSARHDKKTSAPSISGLKQPLSQSERQVLGKYLLHHIQLHCHIPTSLACGAAALQHKAAALVHSVAVECKTQEDLERYFAGIMAWTSDMGTESLLTSFNVSCTAMLPAWWEWQPSPLQHDGNASDDAMPVCCLVSIADLTVMCMSPTDLSRKPEPRYDC